MTNSRRVTDKLATWLDEDIPKVSLDPDISYEMSLVLLPQPDGSFSPSLLLVLFQPSALLGMTNHAQVLINSPSGTAREDLKTAVRNLVQMLEQTRSQQLGQIPPPNHAAPNLYIPESDDQT